MKSAVRESMAGIWPEFEKLLAEYGCNPTAEGGVNEWSAEQGEINQCLLIADLHDAFVSFG